MMPWACIRFGAETHIVPLADLRDHALKACWCSPKEDDEDDTVMIHSALDQREKYENGEMKLQ